MRVVVLADTHIRRGSSRRLPAAARAALEGANVILHAGDIVVGEVLDDLHRYAPVHAVLGNNDRELVGRLPETLELDIGGLATAVIHDSGPRRGRPERLKRRFPSAGLVVFGHSHQPVNEPGIDGQWLLNPGSPTERRRQPHHTIGLFDVERGTLVAPRIVVVSEQGEVDPPGGR
ncbi:MAG TPA: metallophosphoesterase family protein [Nitriliruptorales bacterium]|nr:metallophosphoesterase family protein [Nitriliruptorales bacterium]